MIKDSGQLRRASFDYDLEEWPERWSRSCIRKLAILFDFSVYFSNVHVYKNRHEIGTAGRL